MDEGNLPVATACVEDEVGGGGCDVLFGGFDDLMVCCPKKGSSDGGIFAGRIRDETYS